MSSEYDIPDFPTEFSDAARRGPGLPRELGRLLDAPPGTARDDAWAAFLRVHTSFLLKVARSVARSRDEAMDHYAYVLERLREDDLRRLRAYERVEGTKFTTWLAVVARRLCHDHHRRRYGRFDTEGEPSEAELRRRRLENLAGEAVEISRLSSSFPDPERELRERELSRAVEEAVSRLPDRQQLLIRLRFEDELPVREIAPLMDFPSVFHVYRALKKATAGLRESLEAQGIRNPRP